MAQLHHLFGSTFHYLDLTCALVGNNLALYSHMSELLWNYPRSTFDLLSHYLDTILKYFTFNLSLFTVLLMFWYTFVILRHFSDHFGYMLAL